MRFYTGQYRFYCGVDLHAHTMCVCLLDAAGEIVLERNLEASPETFLAAIAPYRDGLVAACLIPDRYNYDFGRRRLESGSAGAPTFACDVDETAIPPAMPTIVWRAGLDLEPVDLRDHDAVAWLDALVWPEHRARAERLAAAIRLAAGEPPPVQRGDLLRDLDELVAKAPPDATVVVFHSAVLGYLPSRDAIAAFTQHVQELPVRWLSNESPLANPDLAGDETVARAGSRFLLMLDGRPIAFTGPHGQSFELVGPCGIECV